MNKLFALILALVMTPAIVALGQTTRNFSLENIIQRAKAQSPASLQAETRKENRYWQYRFFKSNYNPQVRLNGNVPGFNRDFFPVVQEDGTLAFRERAQANTLVNLGMEQPIALTGGNLSINTNLNQFNDFDRSITEYNSTLFNVFLNQPLFAFNQLKWDQEVEPLRYEESKREYVEEMEFISRIAVDRFFAVLDAQINIQIAQFNLANNDTIYKIELGRYNIGTTSEDKLLQVELQLLRSEQDVSQANLDLETAKLQLRTFIGINEEDEFLLTLPDALPDFSVRLGEALEYARNNRSDFVAFQRRKAEAEQEVARARGQRFQTNLTASIGWNNRGFDLGDLYEDPNSQQRVNVSFNVPIMDWGRNKARMRTAMANQRLNDYIIAQDEINFEQEIITEVRRFEMLKGQVNITRKADEVAQARYNVAQNRYLIGKIDITNLNIALEEKDRAKRSYVAALRSFWSAYYDLRRLTLYDFSQNRLLYNPDSEVFETN